MINLPRASCGNALQNDDDRELFVYVMWIFAGLQGTSRRSYVTTGGSNSQQMSVVGEYRGSKLLTLSYQACSTCC
jgi:hypothetical protein